MYCILNRTLNKEVLLTALAVTGVIVIVFVANNVAYYLSLVVAGKLDMPTAGAIIGLQIPTTMTRFLPLSLLLAVLLVLGRMAQDSELVIFLASGIGYKSIYKTISKMVLVIVMVIGTITLYIIPLVNQQVSLLSQTIGSEAVLENLTAGKFYELQGGNRVIYVENIQDNILSGVFLQINDDDNQHLLKANKGQIEIDDNGNKLLSLYDGTRYSYPKNGLNYTIIHYQKHSVLLKTNEDKTISNNIENKSSVELLKLLDNKNAQAELQWRLSSPIMSIIMVIIGISLSKNKPRSSKYGKLLPGLMLYFLYLNLVNIAYYKIIDEEINMWLGIWPVHILFTLIALFLMQQTTKSFKKAI